VYTSPSSRSTATARRAVDRATSNSSTISLSVGNQGVADVFRDEGTLVWCDVGDDDGQVRPGSRCSGQAD
jgi:hypothetical protein